MENSEASAEAQKAELLEREKALVYKIAQQSESLLQTCTVVDSSDGHPTGMCFINPKDKTNYDYKNSNRSPLEKYMPETVAISDLVKRGVHEAIAIVPVEQEIMGTKKVTKTVTEKGFLGRLKQVQRQVDEPYVQDHRAMTTMEAVGIGSDEPAYSVSYVASDVEDKSVPIESKYRDIAGRPGNYLRFNVILPKSLAEGVSKMSAEDPFFIRLLLDGIVNIKYPRRFVQETWQKYGRPPYSKWNSLKQPSIYVLDAIANPEDKDTLNKAEFIPARVMTSKTAIFS